MPFIQFDILGSYFRRLISDNEIKIMKYKQIN